MSGSKKKKSGTSSIRSSVVTTLKRTDLPADVRDRAAAAAVRAVKPPLPGAISFDVAGVVVDAVTAVVAEEIARQLKADGELAARAERATRQELARTGLAAIAERDALQARIEELEAQLGRPALHAGDTVQICDAGNIRPAVVKVLGNLAGPLVVVPAEEG